MSKGGGRHHLVLTGIFRISRFSLLRCVEVDILGKWNGSVDREFDGGQDVHTLCVITLRLLQFDAATRCNQTLFFVVVFSKSFFVGFRIDISSFSPQIHLRSLTYMRRWIPHLPYIHTWQCRVNARHICWLVVVFPVHRRITGKLLMLSFVSESVFKASCTSRTHMLRWIAHLPHIGAIYRCAPHDRFLCMRQKVASATLCICIHFIIAPAFILQCFMLPTVVLHSSTTDSHCWSVTRRTITNPSWYQPLTR